MSKELALIQFTPNEDGLICEDRSHEIDSASISKEFLDELVEKFGLHTQVISEEYGSCEESTYEFIPNEKLKEILAFLDDRYIREIEATSKELGLTGESSETPQIILREKSLETRLRLQMFLNVFSLIELKDKQFEQDSFAFLKVRS